MAKVLGSHLRAVKAFAVQYTSQPRSSPGTANILSNPNHPLHILFKKRHQARDPKTLWWHVIIQNNQAAKSVVRRHCKRRLKTAVTQVLLERGYDREGRRIIGEGNSDGEGGRTGKARSHEPGLIGFAHFQVLKTMLETSHEDLMKQTRAAVGQLVEQSTSAHRLGAASPVMPLVRQVQPGPQRPR